MKSKQIQVSWTPRRTPLTAVAAAARGEAAIRLVKRLLARDDDHLRLLQGIGGADLAIITGPQDQLPWVDGVTYLGRASGAPDLLLPTNLQPTVPENLLARAIAHAKIPPPVALLVDHRTLVSLAQALPLSRATLVAWGGAELGT